MGSDTERLRAEIREAGGAWRWLSQIYLRKLEAEAICSVSGVPRIECPAYRKFLRGKRRGGA